LVGRRGRWRSSHWTFCSMRPPAMSPGVDFGSSVRRLPTRWVALRKSGAFRHGEPQRVGLDGASAPTPHALEDQPQAVLVAAPEKNRVYPIKIHSFFFAITSPSVHSVQRPENINNLYPVVTSRRESKRANAHRDWSHLALRKPATSRPVDGRYGGHRFSSAMHDRRIIIQTLHPVPEHRPPLLFAPLCFAAHQCRRRIVIVPTPPQPPALPQGPPDS
jgi:hypothetical protein